MNTLRMPGFTAAASLFVKGSQIYRGNASGASSIIGHSVMPQALFGGLGNIGGLGIEPLPPACSECQWTCRIVSCGPGCRREICSDVCTSVPC